MSEEILPQYRLVEAFYADDVLWPAGSILNFDGVPNDQMEPLNEPGRRASEIYMAGLEEGRIRAGLKKNFDISDVVYAAMQNRPREEENRIHVGAVDTPRSADTTVPMMSNIQQAGTKQRGRPRKVELVEQLPENRVAAKKPPLMGTIISQSREGEINSGGGMNV